MNTIFNSTPIPNLTGTIGSIINFIVNYVFRGFSKFCSYLASLVFDVLSTLLFYTEPINNNSMILEMSNWVKTISIIIIALLIAYNAFKLPFSSFSFTRAFDIRTMFERLVVALMLCGYSTFIIDLMIKGNNVLIQTLTNFYKLEFSMNSPMNDLMEGFVGIICTIVIIYLGCKLIIYYYSRIAEIWLYAMLYPAAALFWIDPSRSGYLSKVNSRLSTLIFTQFGHCLVWTFFTIVIRKTFELGSFQGYMISISMLLFMLKVPNIFAEFIGTPSNNFGDIGRHARNAKNNFGKAKRLTGKVYDWVKR